MFGTCIKKDVGISSQLVTASENNMKMNLEVEADKIFNKLIIYLKCCFVFQLLCFIFRYNVKFIIIINKNAIFVS